MAHKLKMLICFRGDPPHDKLMHLSPEFQRCLLAPREMEFELKSFRLSAPPLPNLRLNVLEPIEVTLTVSIETESWDQNYNTFLPYLMAP